MKIITSENDKNLFDSPKLLPKTFIQVI